MARKRPAFLTFAIRAVACVVILGIAGAIYGYFVATKPEVGRSDSDAIVPRVPVMVVREIPVRHQWTGYGVARARFAADVPARVVATVEALGAGVVEGAAIAPGDVLVRLDGSDFERQAEISRQTIADIDAQLERLDVEQESWTARLELAQERTRLEEADYQRVLDALGRGAAQPNEVDQRRQRVISALRDETATREELDKIGPRRLSLNAQRAAQESSRRLADQNVERSVIRCPDLAGARAGVARTMVQALDVEIGESVRVGERVARVVDLGVIEIPLRLPTAARTQVRVGDPIEVRLPGDDARRWTSTVARIAPENDERTRTMTVYVEIEQEDGSERDLAPGQFVRGLVSSSIAHRTTPIPRRSVDRDHVLLVDAEGRIDLVRIVIDDQIDGVLPETGMPDRLWVVPREPLPDGAMLVIVPTRRLAEGVRVAPVMQAGLAGGAQP